MTRRINLLDWRAERRKKRKEQFLAMLGIAALGGAAIVGLGYTSMTSAVTSQQERNAYLQKQIEETEQKIKEIKELEKVKENLLARMRVIEELQASRAASVHFFDEILTTLPDGISLKSINQQGSQITLEGVAESNGRISTYMKNLDASPWFENPQLVVIKTSDKDKVRRGDFQLRVKALTKPQEPGAGPEEDKAEVVE